MVNSLSDTQRSVCRETSWTVTRTDLGGLKINSVLTLRFNGVDIDHIPKYTGFKKTFQNVHFQILRVTNGEACLCRSVCYLLMFHVQLITIQTNGTEFITQANRS